MLIDALSLLPESQPRADFISFHQKMRVWYLNNYKKDGEIFYDF